MEQQENLKWYRIKLIGNAPDREFVESVSYVPLDTASGILSREKGICESVLL